MAENSKPRSRGLVSRVLSGLATGLFNVPSGLAYAQLAGVNPIYGLYSGIVATPVAALSTGTVLMISTITSAIALATGSVLQVAGIQDSQLPQALFTLVNAEAGATGQLSDIFAALWMALIVLLFGSYVEKVPLAVISGMLVVVGVELILGRLPNARLVFRAGAWGPIVALAVTFAAALFVPLQDTIFLGALLSLLLYVGASSHKLRLREALRQPDGSWLVQDLPKALPPHAVTVIVVQGLDFFAEVPALEDQMPPARDVEGAVVVLILRDMTASSSTAIDWLLHYAKTLQANGGMLLLADVDPAVQETLRRSRAQEVLGAENVFPATARVLYAENHAWDAAQAWLTAHPA